MHCHSYCLTQPEHAVYLAWHIYAHTAFKHALFALHCLPCALLTILPVPPVPLYARARTHASITRDDQSLRTYVRPSNERQLHEEQLHEETVLSRSLYRLLNKASHLTAFCA